MRVAILFPVLALAACGGDRFAEAVIVRVEGRERTVADLEAYLDINLPPDARGSLAEEERDDILSRLFDNFLDEQLLLLEAERAGIEVSDAELDSLMRAETIPGAPAKTAVRDLAKVQKFLEGFTARNVVVSEEAVAEHARANRERLAPQEIVVRSVVLETVGRASTLRREIARGKTTFEAVVRELRLEGVQAMPVRLAESHLPDFVREVLQDLRPGQVSAPLELEGSVYLFEIVSRSAGDDIPSEELARRAREDLLRAERRRSLDRLLDELNDRYRPEIFRANLPFRYRDPVDTGR